MFNSKIVYFDEKLNTKEGWVGGTFIGFDNAKYIAQYFKKKNFQLKDSLGQWMRDVINLNGCESAIVVFAQDIMPYDVYDDDFSHAIIRQYLENGGTILWMGDIPFHYRTKDFKKIQMASPSSINMLGVVPVNLLAGAKFSITSHGKKFGLKTSWASSRPIIIPSVYETESTRISCSFLNLFSDTFGKPDREFIELARVEGIGIPWLRPFERKGHIKKFFEYLGIGSFKGGLIEISEPSEKADKNAAGLEFGMSYISAWIKIFNKNIPDSGFVRIWDYAPRVVSEKMLDEALMLIKFYCNKRF